MVQRKATQSCENALEALRRHLTWPPPLFDHYVAMELLEMLAHLASTRAHDKGDEYAAALGEVKTTQVSLEPVHFLCLA